MAQLVVLRISYWAGFVTQFEAMRSCCQTGPTWGQGWGRNWGFVGQSWPQVGHAGPKRCSDGMICKMCNLKFTTVSHVFWRGVEQPNLKMVYFFPSWNCTSWTGCPCVSSAAKLLRLGTFGAGGFWKNQWRMSVQRCPLWSWNFIRAPCRAKLPIYWLVFSEKNNLMPFFFHNPLCLASIYMHKQREFPFKRVASSASNVTSIYVFEWTQNYNPKKLG